MLHTRKSIGKFHQYNSKTHQIVTTKYVKVRVTIKNTYVTIKMGRVDQTHGYYLNNYFYSCPTQ